MGSGKRSYFYRERLVREEEKNSILGEEFAQISPYENQIKNEDWRSCHEWLSTF